MMSVLINVAVLKWVTASFITGSLIGFTFRSRQIAKSKKRILELETEMVENHAEILRLHKIHSEQHADKEKVPVISLALGDAATAGNKTKAKA